MICPATYVRLAHGVFALDDDEIATVQDLSAAGTDKLRLAADACPTRAITIAEGADDARAYAKTRPRTASPAQLEMGGHNPLIAMSDADINRAVTAAYAGAFMAAGQKCTAARRIFVRIYGEFRERLLARMRQAVIGDPADPRTGVGATSQRASVQRRPGRHRTGAA
jgi:acyl-CoA reductase-like NAD-dependent aldehyde dehydrogenase